MNPNHRTVAIIQARMGSERLPGKVLLPLFGVPVISRDIERISRARAIDRIVVATTDTQKDDALVEALSSMHPEVTVFRGSEDDVLDRYYRSAKQAGAGIVVRITSDCPLVDPDVIDRVVDTLKADAKLDYVSNVLGRRTFPRGLDVEALSFSALERLRDLATEKSDREHVTLYVKKHPEVFKTATVTNTADLSFHRWTLDEPADYVLLSRIYDALYANKPDFRMEDVLTLFNERPELLQINRSVEQKLSNF